MQQYRKNLGKVSLTAEGAWDGTKAFDILSIVYDEHTNHGFISRRDVPEGVDLYNKEYWMPFNVSGYADNNIIILSQKTSESAIKSYTLEEAIKSIASVGRKPGAILGFYNENTDRLDIGGRWELWQYNGVDVADWENVNSWDSIYYNYNKFVGWYCSEEALKKYIPFPEIGCYSYVGSDLNEAVIYRCDRKYAWTNTTEHVWDYIKVIVGGNVTVGENGNWFNNGVDTNIPASIKGENGKTPIIRNNDNVLEVSYDNVNWETISDEVAVWARVNNNKLEITKHKVGGWEVVSDYIAAWFRWQSQGGQQANSTGKIQITRDGITWTDLSGEFINNLRISRYIGADESLPISGIAEGTIYAKGPYYEEDDTLHDNPIYRLWVYAWKGNTLAWQDNGEFQSIAAGIVQETGNSETEVMSQKATTEKLTELATQVIYDVSVNNDGATFASLSVLLSSENLSTLIPTAVRCGGMSIRFVQSSDNKYVQYRLMKNVWSVNNDDWSFCGDDVLVECSEYIHVETDKKGRIIWAVKIDGTIYWGAGVPQQVIDYVASKIIEYHLEDVSDIVSFVGDLTEGDNLSTLLAAKVDKETGKGLIDTDFASSVSYENSNEFLSAFLDKKNKILEGANFNGEKIFYTNVELKDGLKISDKIKNYLSNVLEISNNDATDIAGYYSKHRQKEILNLRRWSDFKFFFFSDVHASQTNVERILELAENFGNSEVNCIINGGDTVAGLSNEGLQWYNNLVDGFSIPVLSIAGNHDCWKDRGWNWATGLEVYNLVTAKVKETVPSIVQPNNAATDGLNYYYYDYNNIRIICILSFVEERNHDNNHYFDAAQNTWLAGVLEDARTTYHYWKIINYVPVAYTLQSGDEVYMTLANDAELNNKTQQEYIDENLEGKIYAVPMSVIIVNHAPFNTKRARRIESKKLNSWIDYTKDCIDKNISFDQLTVSEDAVTTVANYISSGGSFICWLTGHTHTDNVLTHSLHEGQLMINISSSNYNNHQDGVVTDDVSKPDYDCFDYIGVDLRSGMFKVIRVGWAEDSSMRIRNSWCYDYVNKTLLSEN